MQHFETLYRYRLNEIGIRGFWKGLIATSLGAPFDLAKMAVNGCDLLLSSEVISIR